VTRYVAVIDLGKTNSKLALVDTAMAQEIQVIKQSTVVNAESPYPSLDHQKIEAFIVSALHELCKTQSIDAVTVTTHGATAALIDATGQLAMPVMDYEFSGVDELRREYNEHRPSFAETGSPALPGGLNIGAQLYWQQTMFAAQFEKVNTILTWPQYWIFKLTGERHNDVTSLGCHTDLYEPQHQRYSTLVAKQQWQKLMPPTRHSGQLSGPLLSTFATRSRMPPGVPVYTGIHDSNASLVPHLVSQKAPFSVVSTGTWFISMAIGGAAAQLNEHRDTLINVNARGETVPSARFMGGRERELLGVSEPVSEQAMNNFLGKPDPNLMLMPSVVPGTGPYPNVAQQWLHPGTEPNHLSLACATTLYLALMTHECMLLIGANGPTFIEGPLARDEQYAQMLAATSKRSVMTGKSKTGTSVGAAMLINAPVNKPDFTQIKLDANKRARLERYGKLWKQLLAEHLKNRSN